MNGALQAEHFPLVLARVLENQTVERLGEGWRTISRKECQPRPFPGETGRSCLESWQSLVGDFQANDRIIQLAAITAGDCLDVKVDSAICPSGYFGAVTALGAFVQVRPAHNTRSFAL